MQVHCIEEGIQARVMIIQKAQLPAIALSDLGRLLAREGVRHKPRTDEAVVC